MTATAECPVCDGDRYLRLIECDECEFEHCADCSCMAPCEDQPVVCSVCSTAAPPDKDAWDDIDVEWFEWCHRCSADHCDKCGCPERGIYSYSYRPRFRPKGAANDRQLMGVELEIGGKWAAVVEAAHTVDPGEDHLYVKEEGSIRGAEIVTHPMTLAYARQYPFPALLEELRVADCGVGSDYGDCDLHVHVDRRWFRCEAHAAAWTLFVYRNEGPVIKLARNNEKSVERWAGFRDRGRLAARIKRSPACTRYTAINWLNRDTAEVRFFKSTLDVQEFYAAVEFVHAAIEYTRSVRSCDVRGGALGWEQFTPWVAGRDYPNLHAEIRKQVTI